MVTFTSKKIQLICLFLFLMIIPATVWFISGVKFAIPKLTNSSSLLATNAEDSIFTLTPSPIKTVFVIVMENQDWKTIISSSSAGYIKQSLLPHASYATQYYTPPGVHPSERNYLWMEAGTDFGVTNDNLPKDNHKNTVNHLTTLLSNNGISWKSYQEGINGKKCPLEDSGLYTPRHNPMIFFDDIADNNNSDSVSCNLHIRPFEELSTDLINSTVPRYAFITPNLCHDMHNSTGCDTSDQIENGDAWLATVVPQIVNSSAYRDNGTLFITWDEGTGKSDGTESDGPIGMILMSPLAKGNGYSNTIRYTHSSFLLTMEEIFNVKPLLGDAANATDLRDLFGSITPTTAVKKVAVINNASQSATHTPTLTPVSTPTPTKKIIVLAATNTPTLLQTKKPTATATLKPTPTHAIKAAPTKAPHNTLMPTVTKQVAIPSWLVYPQSGRLADTGLSFTYPNGWQIVYQKNLRNTIGEEAFTFLFYPEGNLSAQQDAIIVPNGSEKETLSVHVYDPSVTIKQFIATNFFQYAHMTISVFGQMGNKSMYQVSLPSSDPLAQQFGVHGIVLGGKHSYDIGFIHIMSKDVVNRIGTDIWPNFKFE